MISAGRVEFGRVSMMATWFWSVGKLKQPLCSLSGFLSARKTMVFSEIVFGSISAKLEYGLDEDLPSFCHLFDVFLMQVA